MALATRCPHCETVFRLDPHLLAPHDGRVRCGHCQEVFDAAHHQFEVAADEAPVREQHATTRDETVAIQTPAPALRPGAAKHGATPAVASAAQAQGFRADAPNSPAASATSVSSERAQPRAQGKPAVSPQRAVPPGDVARAEASVPSAADGLPKSASTAPISAGALEPAPPTHDASHEAPSTLNGHAQHVTGAPIEAAPAVATVASTHPAVQPAANGASPEARLEALGKPGTKSFVTGSAAPHVEHHAAEHAKEPVEARAGRPVEHAAEPRVPPAAERRAEPSAPPSPQTRIEPSLKTHDEPRDDTRAEPFVAPAAKAADKPFVRARTGPFAERVSAAAEARPESAASPRPAAAEPDTRAEPFVEPFVEPGAHGRSEPFVGPARGAPKASPSPASPAKTEPPPRPATGSWQTDPEPHFAASAAGASGLPSTTDGEAEPFPLTRETPGTLRSPRSRRIAGIVIAVVLALALIVQLAWWHRETVMVFLPASQSLYADVCEELGCTVAPPRDIDGLQIENSGLRQVDGPHKLELKLMLSNRFDVALAYPALEVTLLDDKNNVAIRRVLWPQDYARPGTIFGAGLAPRSTQAVVVRLDTGDVVAANYRVQVFYP